MSAGRVEHAWIPMPDGVRLAATLYLPESVPGERAPCLLEALPYRKDDLTASYRSEYVRFRDEHGYAVARVDLRGTGSSGGVALDEYHPQEQADLHEVIAWLAAQPWCTGAVGMFGTSWSGFNSLQMACERPPALKAVVASYATDDRWTDDVHYMGGALRLLDLVDYPLYMVAMNALPPVPALYARNGGASGDPASASAPGAPSDAASDGSKGWREEWVHRVEQTPAWLLTWLENQADGPYWRHGSVRGWLADARSGRAATPSYERITCATMLIAGWADGYRNNTFRTVRALSANGAPVHLLAGPWSHMGPASSVPGPRVDHVPLMARWWDRWLRDVPNGVDTQPSCTIFVRRYAEPQPDAVTWPGRWQAHDVSTLDAVQVLDLPLAAADRPADRPADASGPGGAAGGTSTNDPTHAALATGAAGVKHPARATGVTRATGSTHDVDEVGPVVSYRPAFDVGVTAWNSCAAAQPWGQPQDQSPDDARSLCLEWDLPHGAVVLGHPRLRLRVRPDHPVTSVSAKLSLVPPAGGPSLLVSRGLLNLAYRDGNTTEPVACVPGEWLDVEVELEATAFEAATEGGGPVRARLALACTDWPNTLAPPGTWSAVDLGASRLTLPVPPGTVHPEPVLPAPPEQSGDQGSEEDADDGESGSSSGRGSSNSSSGSTGSSGGSSVSWRHGRDVLRHRTFAEVDHGSSNRAEFDSACREHYTGRVEVDARTGRQSAVAASRFDITWPEARVSSEARLDLQVDAENFDIRVSLDVREGDETVATREWHRRIPRRLA